MASENATRTPWRKVPRRLLVFPSGGGGVLVALWGTVLAAHWRITHDRERGSIGSWLLSAGGLVVGIIGGVVLTESLGRL